MKVHGARGRSCLVDGVRVCVLASEAKELVKLTDFDRYRVQRLSETNNPTVGGVRFFPIAKFVDGKPLPFDCGFCFLGLREGHRGK